MQNRVLQNAASTSPALQLFNAAGNDSEIRSATIVCYCMLGVKRTRANTQVAGAWWKGGKENMPSSWSAADLDEPYAISHDTVA